MIETDTSLRTVNGLADNLAICDFSNIEIAKILLNLLARAEKAEAAARESAMQELASLGQAAEAHAAQLKAEAAIKRQSGAAATIRAFTLAEVKQLKEADRSEYFASKSLQGELELNAMLTDENEKITAERDALQAEVDRLRAKP